MSQYFGKYRGKVEDNKDTDKLGRLKVSVPAIFGDAGPTWAIPSVPYAGKDVGFFMLPPVGACVWVEFEDGNPDYPIWSGCFWNKDELPSEASSPEVKILKTGIGTITINDSGGAKGIIIETTDNMKITLNSSSIEITNSNGATVKLDGSKTSINDTALEVE